MSQCNILTNIISVNDIVIGSNPHRSFLGSEWVPDFLQIQFLYASHSVFLMKVYFVLYNVTSGYHVMRGAGLRHLIDCVDKF